MRQPLAASAQRAVATARRTDRVLRLGLVRAPSSRDSPRAFPAPDRTVTRKCPRNGPFGPPADPLDLAAVASPGLERLDDVAACRRQGGRELQRQGAG